MITETSQLITCFISMKSEILSDHTPTCGRVPRTSPPTARTVTTRHSAGAPRRVRSLGGDAEVPHVAVRWATWCGISSPAEAQLEGTRHGFRRIRGQAAREVYHHRAYW
jgi:hypothetical protein